MEQDLHVRDRVGVQDFVLLENPNSETEFIENLQKRFKEDLIYVSQHSIISKLNLSIHTLAFKNFLSLDVHRISVGVGKSIQEPSDLLSGVRGKIPKCQFLRTASSRVRYFLLKSISFHFKSILLQHLDSL